MTILEFPKRKCGCGTEIDARRARCNPCQAAYMRKWRKANPQGSCRNNPREAARAIARQSKHRGTLKAKPCAICGDLEAQMHHVDHERPLDVTWLCETHHKAWHTFWRGIVLEQFEQWIAAQHRAMAGQAGRAG